MEFRTKITVARPDFVIKHSSRVMLLGSCFSDNIGSRMERAMMHVVKNPFGALYNASSIRRAVNILTEESEIRSGELFEANGVWNSFNFHSSYSRATCEETLAVMNGSIHLAAEHLRQCDVLFITLGTAFVYRLKNSDGRVVSNCHKLPADCFTRSLMSVDDVAGELMESVKMLLRVNPQLRIIFTVSPIRHISDGLSDNCLSKSILRVAIARVVRAMPDACGYFPSYEILIDDLRDYRFYASDMTHPSEVAVDYIWDVLIQTYFGEDERRLIERCERMTRRLQHRPMSHNAEVVARFRADTQTALSELIAELPYIVPKEPSAM